MAHWQLPQHVSFWTCEMSFCVAGMAFRENQVWSASRGSHSRPRCAYGKTGKTKHFWRDMKCYCHMLWSTDEKSVGVATYVRLHGFELGIVECKTCRMQSAECESPSRCRVLSLFGCVLRHPRRKRLSEDLQRLPRHAFIKDAFGFVDSIRICGGHTILVGGLEHEFYFFHHIGNVIIPTDFHIFQRGRSTTNMCALWLVIQML